jgi:hypothetical protein
MKSYLLTLPVAALMCGAAFAETATTATGTTGDTYGSTWSRSTGAMFYSDPEMTTMRTPDEISSSWSTLSQEDRDAVMAECTRYRTDTGTTAATDTGTTTETETGTGAATGTETTTGTETATGTDTTTATEGTATDGTMAAPMNVSAENMKMICDMVEAY